MDIESNISDDNLLEESSINLQSALSALVSETENVKFLQNVKICMGYMSMFSISDLEKELLQWVMPALKNTIQKVFDDNFLLSDTCEDEFVLNILRENFKLILEILTVLKEILEFIIENSKVSLSQVKNVAVTTVQVISSTFDHCRKSAGPLKANFDSELSNIFNIMQNIHPLFFRLMEHCELVTDALKDQTDVQVLSEVLDNLCTISENLFFLNIKSLTINWKGYLNIALKFSAILKDQIDLKRPIAYLTSLICDNLSSVKEPDAMELSTTQIIQLSGFLIKVVLKLYGIYWVYRKNMMFDIMEFCCIIYSFTPYKFLMMELPWEIAKFVDDTIFVHLKSFLLTLYLDDFFSQVILNKMYLSDKYCYGFLNVLNTCLEIAAGNEDNGKCNLETLVMLIFQCVKLSNEEFFWPLNIFDDLVINISASVMTHDRCYKKVELILLENVLQENIVGYFLAAEIWCLLLRNANPRFCSDTLTNLIKIYLQLDFGNNTHRLEHIYLISLIRRVFLILPDYLKRQLMQNVNINSVIWKKIGFKHFPKQSNSIVEDVYADTLEKLEKLKRDDFSGKDLVTLVENLNGLSTVNYEQMTLPCTNLVNTIENIWKLEFSDTTNNLFKYFIVSFCKITSNFVVEFNNKQLYTILNQLSNLSSVECLKIHVCLTLRHFCDLNAGQLGQDGCRIYKIVSNLLSNLLLTSNNIVKQYVLEILEVLNENGKLDVVADVINGCRSNNALQKLISNFLEKNYSKGPINEDYFKNLGKVRLSHDCVEWKKEENGTFKKIKLDTNYSNKVENVSNEDKSIPKDVGGNSDIKKKLSSFMFRPQGNKPPVEETLNSVKIEADDSIDEVLSRIKGEVKCLNNILKTEKLSTKNCSDIKVISNQLLSLM